MSSSTSSSSSRLDAFITAIAEKAAEQFIEKIRELTRVEKIRELKRAYISDGSFRVTVDLPRHMEIAGFGPTEGWTPGVMLLKTSWWSAARCWHRRLAKLEETANRLSAQTHALIAASFSTLTDAEFSGSVRFYTHTFCCDCDRLLSAELVCYTTAALPQTCDRLLMRVLDRAFRVLSAAVVLKKKCPATMMADKIELVPPRKQKHK